MFGAFKQCSEPSNNVRSLQTMFGAFKQCLWPKNNVWELFSLFGTRKQCLDASNIVLGRQTLFEARPASQPQRLPRGREEADQVVCFRRRRSVAPVSRGSSSR